VRRVDCLCPRDIWDLIDSDEKVDLITYFHNDIRRSGTFEQLAIRLGRDPARVRRALDDFVELGLMKKVDEVYSFETDRDRVIQALIQAAMKPDSDRSPE
jgi:DNA-binding IclR family transcriptional regulator